jgi:hydrogenase maturation protein HypF
MMVRKALKIKGVVQGVGFRPFIYRLAEDLGLTGYVRNTSEGVEAAVEGPDRSVDRFLKRIDREKPPASRIDRIIVRAVRPRGSGSFSIRDSRFSRGVTRLSPDIAVCPECRREFYDFKDRRYLYPFINCTNCGPRYSIITGTPYDRNRTAMKKFLMCPDCRREFGDVRDRRFHAQPDCCPVCGPRFTLYSVRGRKIPARDPILKAADLIRQGRIVAVKGIGGFQIACDARNAAAVARLRKLKGRPTKPFAVMADRKDAAKIAYPTGEEMAILCDPAAPIVLLRKKGRRLCPEIAPANPYLGLMLPYAPVHYRLLEKVPFLVMTSANLKDEPLVRDDRKVKKKLGSIVSHYLTHDRDILNRADDSVGYVRPGSGFSIIRRSRGFAPNPVDLPFPVSPTLAVGPLLKNTFTLAARGEAYISPHIGDLEDRATLDFFRETMNRYRRWFRIEPERIAHDLHPDYLSTRLAQTLPGRKIGIQHHCAHVAACMGENRIPGKVIGIAFDGTGYGLDGRIWGGEFFYGGYRNLRRVGHLEYLPLPGGEASIRKPYRIAIAYLYHLLGGNEGRPIRAGRSEIKAIHEMIDHGFNLAYTSSMGRLFDCVAGLLGIMPEITYEAEAAIRLEHCARPGLNAHYPFAVEETEDGLVVRVAGTLKAILHDLGRTDAAGISAKFHNTVSRFALDICRRLRKIYGVNQICLSGGVFQNRLLSRLMIRDLTRAEFKVFTHHRLPDNDGCVSYGQVILANIDHA